ncbi:hypothetical protein N0B44_13765 [Roseibacterium beibuensis]|uniref:Uncharacterized protein n=2 Tax=[Roseibacterium] beibuensis TaxID=1193142 RepID=A0ABP9L9N7_9RHOB|nr:hypothetical protein [Roseibacterium beibuensis]MCS6623980.1 hypothetical protein [Roseibacterium beibuensis]
MAKLGCLFVVVSLLTLPLPDMALAEGGGVLRAPQTGLTGVFTDQTVISRGAHHVLMGHIIVATRGGERHIALVIQQRRDGVHYLRYSQAFAGGMELPFRRMTGQTCNHGHCRDRPVGLIALSPEMLRHFSTTGLTARLTGRSGAIDLVVPASLFSEAHTRASVTGLLEDNPPD